MYFLPFDLTPTECDLPTSRFVARGLFLNYRHNHGLAGQRATSGVWPVHIAKWTKLKPLSKVLRFCMSRTLSVLPASYPTWKPLTVPIHAIFFTPSHIWDYLEFPLLRISLADWDRSSLLSSHRIFYLIIFLDFHIFVVLLHSRLSTPFSVFLDHQYLIPYPRNRRYAKTVCWFIAWTNEYMNEQLLIPLNTGHDLLRRSKNSWHVGHWKQKLALSNPFGGALGRHAPLWLTWLWVVMWTQLDLIMQLSKGTFASGSKA